LIHDWYMIQCGTVDPRAQKMVFDDSLMGQLIRFVCSHEVGHALGLRHNMGASSTVPVDSLRNKKWVEANGFCPSIMDYARFNYVAQPEDHISEKGLMPRIGIYDKWAIEWGYRLYPGMNTPESEVAFLNRLVIKKMKDSRLWYGPETSNDPRIQTEDLGDDAAKASMYGIKNLKLVTRQLLHWTYEPNEGYNNLNEIYNRIQAQYCTYIIHVLNNMTGVYENMKGVDEPGSVYSPISVTKQKQAYDFIKENFFATPSWIIDTAILTRTGQTSLGVIGNIQTKILDVLFFPTFFGGMYSRGEATFGSEHYSLVGLLSNLKKDIWSELFNNQSIDTYRRSLQIYYVRCLMRDLIANKEAVTIQIILPISGRTSLFAADVAALLTGHLKELQAEIKKHLPLEKDPATKAHLEYIDEEINIFWKNSPKIYY